MSAWIDVNDRLPEFFGNYLVWLKPVDPVLDIEVMQIAVFYNGDQEFDAPETLKVTHWQHLPAPPAK